MAVGTPCGLASEKNKSEAKNFNDSSDVLSD